MTDISVTERPGIRRAGITPNGDGTFTLNVHFRDEKALANGKDVLPLHWQNNEMAMFDKVSNVAHLPLDGISSRGAMDYLLRADMPAAAVEAPIFKQALAEGAVAGQVKAALAHIPEGLIAPVSMDSAPQNVTNVGGNDRGTVLG